MGAKRSRENKDKVIEREQLSIMEWYEMVSGTEPKEQYDNTVHTATGPVRTWYLLPLIDGVRNPALVIESIGDTWQVRRVPIEKGIRSVGGI